MTSLRDLAEKALGRVKQPVGRDVECGCQHYTDYSEFATFAREALPKLAEGYLTMVGLNGAHAKHVREVLQPEFDAMQAKLAIAREALEWVVSKHPKYATADDMILISAQALEETK